MEASFGEKYFKIQYKLMMSRLKRLKDTRAQSHTYSWPRQAGSVLGQSCREGARKTKTADLSGPSNCLTLCLETSNRCLVSANEWFSTCYHCEYSSPFVSYSEMTLPLFDLILLFLSSPLPPISKEIGINRRAENTGRLVGRSD